MVNNRNEKYLFPLSIQLTMSDDLYCPDFVNTLAILAEYGFYGIELNIIDFDKYRPAKYVDLLADYNLKLVNIASGAYAKRLQLSLSSEDSAIRKRAVAETKGMIQFASEIDTGVICGFLKGNAVGNRDLSNQNFIKSLSELDADILLYKTPFLIEATNRYESTIVNTLSDAVGIISSFTNPYMRLLPDTFHMNIEEADTNYALLQHRDYFKHLHISDNNRHFPGYGAIDFSKIFALLKGMGYQGSVAIEGNPYHSLKESIIFSAQYLNNISYKLLPTLRGGACFNSQNKGERW